MDDQPPRRRAALPRGADGAEQHRRHDEIEIGIVRHDHRIVARAFEQALAEATGDRRRDLAPDRRGAGERDERDARIARRARASRRCRRWRAGRSAAARARVITRLARCWTATAVKRRFRRRLPHRRVAAYGSEHRVPRPHGDGKIERGDHANHAQRMPLLHHPVLRPLGRDRAPVEHPRLADREVGDVDHFLHFAVALGLDLAVLECDQRAERVLVLAQQRAEAPHRLAALRAPAPRARRARPSLAAASTASTSVASARRTRASARPVAGLSEAICCPPPRHAFGPRHAPRLSAAMPSRASSASDALGRESSFIVGTSEVSRSGAVSAHYWQVVPGVAKSSRVIVLDLRNRTRQGGDHDRVVERRVVAVGERERRVPTDAIARLRAVERIEARARRAVERAGKESPDLVVCVSVATSHSGVPSSRR